MLVSPNHTAINMVNIPVELSCFVRISMDKS